MPYLEVQNMKKSFTLHVLGGKEITALKGISFAVEKGEFLGIIGRSGSGKSSLLKCIYRTYLPSEGSILYWGDGGGPIDLATASTAEVLRLRQHYIGYVSQFLRAIPRVTAVDLVAEPLLSRGMAYQEARIEVLGYLQHLQLSAELWDSYPVLFSGGEQQRVSFARAMVAQPPLLLLDEPTASLDDHTQEFVIEMLLEAKARGMTMVGVFHNLSVLTRLADRILVLNDGMVEGITESSSKIALDEYLRKEVHQSA
jgi:phosphonate C-P lyase system protein PhnL